MRSKTAEFAAAFSFGRRSEIPVVRVRLRLFWPFGSMIQRSSNPPSPLAL